MINSRRVRSIVWTSRVNASDLATCINFLISEGTVPTSQSDAINRIVEILANSVPTKHHILTEPKARDFLREVGLLDLKNAKRLIPEVRNIKLISDDDEMLDVEEVEIDEED